VDSTEWDTRVAAYAVVVDVQDRLLLTWYNGSRPHPEWTLPGGGVDFAESLEAAVVREVKEETGYDVAIGQALATSTWTTPDAGPLPPRPYKSVRVVFAATVIGGSLGRIEVGGTTDSAVWIPLDQVLETAPAPGRNSPAVELTVGCRL
jgi:8-oxo-dGTP diphosphatase